MTPAIFMAALVLASGGTVQPSENVADDVAFTCLSKGPVLVVGVLAVATQSPNEQAASQAAAIAETCAAAKASLEVSGHVCLKMVSDNERLADQLSRTYAGRMPVADFVAAFDGDADGSENQKQSESNAQCATRMAPLQSTLAREIK